MQKVTVLGSTGSIGQNTLKVIQESDGKYAADVLVANANVEILARQAIECNASVAVVADKSRYAELKNLVSGRNVKIEAGQEAVIEAARVPNDIVMSAIVGAAGLAPTMAAIERGARIALANKECLVCAGGIMTNAAKQSGAEIIPVDSEHSAIFQVFNFENSKAVEKIILTASGGPFRNAGIEEMRRATPGQAISHPNWSMGQKISVDSATMMNKGLEIIEAYHLFPVEQSQIEVVIHPESVVHSLVEYIDGSVLAQLGTPDMCTPISLALAWPERIPISHRKLNLVEIGQLSFMPVSKDKFPAIDLCYNAIKRGGNIPAALSSANEVAVSSFLRGKIGFLDIVPMVENVTKEIGYCNINSIEDVFATIDEAKDMASAALRRKAA